MDALYIDPDTRDLVFDDEGILRTVFGDDATAQAVRLALLVYKGEWPLDMSHGTDYDRIMGVHGSRLSDDTIAEVIREAVYQEDQVDAVEDISIGRDGRTLSISVEGTLRGGGSISINNMEVG